MTEEINTLWTQLTALSGIEDKTDEDLLKIATIQERIDYLYSVINNQRRYNSLQNCR